MSSLYNILDNAIEEKLKTEHLLLRPYAEGDEQEFMQLLLDKATELAPAYTGRATRVRALDDARAQVAQLRTDWDNRKEFSFGAWLKSPYTYMGDISLKNIDRSVPKAEAALYFKEWPDMAGIAEEALQAVLTFAFDTLQINKVYMRCTEQNELCCKVAESCGFVSEGVLRSDFKGADSEDLLDLSYYGITRTDYEQLAQRKASNSPMAMT